MKGMENVKGNFDFINPDRNYSFYNGIRKLANENCCNIIRDFSGNNYNCEQNFSKYICGHFMVAFAFELM